MSVDLIGKWWKLTNTHIIFLHQPDYDIALCAITRENAHEWRHQLADKRWCHDEARAEFSKMLSIIIDADYTGH